MSKTGAAFSVRFLRNGDQITVVRNVIDSAGNGAALFQVVDTTTGTPTPDWTQAAKQPIIQIGIRSAAGYPTEITNVTWAYDGKTLNFTYNGSAWVTANNNSSFQARINGNYYELKIVNNIASKDVVSNKQISYEISYVSNAHSDSLQGSIDVLIQQAGSDSHNLQITTNLVELDASNTEATLTAVAYYGTTPVGVGTNGYAIEWYQDNVKLSGQTGATLTVNRDMVSGGSIFVAKLLKDGNVVAQDGQRINDIADEYQITYTPTNAGSNYVAPGHSATFNLAVIKNGNPFTGEVSFSWQIYNALGEPRTSVTSSKDNKVTVNPSDCLVGTGDNAYYSDCDVQVTADF